MAYDYGTAKKAWESMNQQQKQNYATANANNANFQRFAQEYNNEMNG
jgi:hypothetical protein